MIASRLASVGITACTLAVLVAAPAAMAAHDTTDPNNGDEIVEESDTSCQEREFGDPGSQTKSDQKAEDRREKNCRKFHDEREKSARKHAKDDFKAQEKQCKEDHEDDKDAEKACKEDVKQREKDAKEQYKQHDKAEKECWKEHDEAEKEYRKNYPTTPPSSACAQASSFSAVSSSSINVLDLGLFDLTPAADPAPDRATSAPGGEMAVVVGGAALLLAAAELARRRFARRRFARR